MIELRDKTFIDVAPEKVWEWLASMPEHYVAWHANHVSCRWVRGCTIEIGAEMEFVELLHGKEHRLRVKVTDVEHGQRMNYRVLPGLEGSFEVAGSGSGSCFSATIRFGVDAPILGRLIDRFLLMRFGDRIKAIGEHQAEEGENLKSLLESANNST